MQTAQTAPEQSQPPTLRLRFLTSVASDRFSYKRTLQGQNPIEVPAARARELIRAGYAVEDTGATATAIPTAPATRRR